MTAWFEHLIRLVLNMIQWPADMKPVAGSEGVACPVWEPTPPRGYKDSRARFSCGSRQMAIQRRLLFYPSADAVLLQ